MLLRSLLAGLALAMTPLPVAHAQDTGRRAWTQPMRPFHIVGPIYYVGTKGIGVYLIRTKVGAILLDAGPQGAARYVEDNIAALGLRLTDVKLMLATHAHWDHVGGLARLKRDTGAIFVASAGDRAAYESGRPPSDGPEASASFSPVKVDRVLTDAVPVTLGGVAMTPWLTPGHTPGCTTWTMRVTERGRPLHVVFPCSLTVAGRKLVDNRRDPQIVGQFRGSFTRLRALKADVVLPAHPEVADVLGRARRREAGDVDAFIAPGLLQQVVLYAEAKFDGKLAEARAAARKRS